MRRGCEERRWRPAAIPGLGARGLAGRGLAVMGLVAAGCAGVDASESALVMLDDEARAAGIVVEVDGEPQRLEGPIAVPARDAVAIARQGRRELIEARAGEVIAIEGAEGRVRRDADPGRLVLAGSAEGASRVAELSGMHVTELPDGRFVIDGENAAWTALLFPDGPGIDGWSPWSPELARSSGLGWAPGWTGEADGAWGARAELAGEPEPSDGERAPAGSSVLAAFVGAYAADDVVLVLDASGGLTMTGRGVSRRGSYALDRHAQLVLRFEDGAVSMHAQGEELRDPAGVRFRTLQTLTGLGRVPGIGEPATIHARTSVSTTTGEAP